MDMKSNFDASNDESFNTKSQQQKSLNEKASPTQKKNNNNIQMSYYFPNNNSHENAEKESEFLNNISSLPDSFSKMNIKVNNEISHNSNFNAFENNKNEPENYMFYNNNQNYNKISHNQIPAYNKKDPNFPGNFNNPNSPNINYFNNFQHQQQQQQQLNPNTLFKAQNIPQNNDFREDLPPNMNKIFFKQTSNQQNMQGNPNSGPTFFDDEQYPENSNQKEKNRNAKKIFESNLLSYQPHNKSYAQIARFFVIKSVDEDNIHKSIKFRIWCSTFKGNQKLQKAFKEAENSYPIYLFFSVNGSGRFLGLAQMTSEVDYHANFNYWSQGDKWKGFFFVVWLIIKDVPNKAFRHIINEYNEAKPITSSRDTQEIHPASGMEALKIFKEYPYESSILDDFQYYEKKQNNFSGVQQMQNQQIPQQQFYNNLPNPNIGINNKNQNYSNPKFNMQNQQQNNNNNSNEDIYQSLSVDEYGNINSNNNAINTNFQYKNQIPMKKEMNDRNFHPGNYINN